MGQPQYVDNYLAHYGVMGMRWGKSGAGKSASGSTTKSISGKPVKTVAGKPVTTVVGKAKPSSSGTKTVTGRPHEDAKRAKTAKTKADTKGTDSLSNKELQDVITRMNLEQQYSKLSPKTTSAGQKFAKDLLVNTAKQQASQMASKAAAKGIQMAMDAALKR